MNSMGTKAHLRLTLVLISFFVSLVFLVSCKEENSNILVESIKIEGNYITDGSSSQLSVTVLPEDATNKEVEWSVSDTDIASITQDGLIAAISNGNIEVIATAKDGSGISAKKLFSVSGVVVDVASITISGSDITDGLPKQLTSAIEPADATYQEIKWSVSDETVAVIGNEGLLTPLTNGQVTVKAALVADELIFDELVVNISGIIETIETNAFPGAEGFAKDITGGRGGKVIYVTNLNDSGTGSLRAAISQSGPRYILFKVSGTIKLLSTLNIRNGDVTIAGQTAPGDGITIRDYPVVVAANNVVIRFMRFRMGDAAQQEGDAIGGRFYRDIMIDHCSMSWSTDECVSFYVNENTTVQWCWIAESLRNSVHDKGAHGYGGIWGGKRASFHHNLLAHHSSRNPRLGESAGTDFALSDLVDLRNNVIYNWGYNSCYGAEAMNVNIVNCYYKPGPATTTRERIISIDYNKTEGTPIYQTWGKFYIDGNYISGSSRATSDNWAYGVYNQFHSSYGTVSESDKSAMRLSAPHDIENNVYTHTAEEAYEKVMLYGGASIVRDGIDTRILSEVKAGTYTYTGSNGSTLGIIDTQTDVGGWPELASGTAPTDSSGDGMPDIWKLNHGLDPSKSETNGHQLHAGYENIEIYLNSLVEQIINNQK